MRDLTRVVLAEDDRKRADECRRILESVGGYTVWVTGRMNDVINLLKKSGAAWLILDLELEDGNSVEIMPTIRERFGGEVFILVLTGHWDRQQENVILNRGANLMIRKPYNPTALVSQMSQMRDLREGRNRCATDETVLKIGKSARLDLQTGICTVCTPDGDEEIRLTGIHTRLLRYMASMRDPVRHVWVPVERNTLLGNVWGGEALFDVERSGNNLRKNIQRLRALLHCNPVRILHHYTHTTQYALSDQIVPMDELPEAEQALEPLSEDEVLISGDGLEDDEVEAFEPRDNDLRAQAPSASPEAGGRGVAPFLGPQL